MTERRINTQEVVEALSNVYLTAPGHPGERINRWGTTVGGRRLRVTQPADRADVVITVAEVQR